MAKKKSPAKSKQKKIVAEYYVTVLPSQVFNTDGVSATAEYRVEIAKQFRYEWMVHGGSVFYVPSSGGTVVAVPGLDASVILRNPHGVQISFDKEPTEGGVPTGFTTPEPQSAWVVSRVAWEYNDEYYYRPDENPVHPLAVYTDPAVAEGEARQTMVDEVANDTGYFGNPFDYMFGENYSGPVTADQFLHNLREDPWIDLLQEHGIEPPARNESGDFTPQILTDWWTSNVGEYNWTLSKRNKSVWTPEQIRFVVSTLQNFLFDVEKVIYGG